MVASDSAILGFDLVASQLEDFIETLCNESDRKQPDQVMRPGPWPRCFLVQFSGLYTNVTPLRYTLAAVEVHTRGVIEVETTLCRGYSFLQETLPVNVYTGFFLIHVQMSMRLKCSNNCCAVALCLMIEFISAKASSTESVERERGQNVLNSLSELLQRFCKKALPLSEHAASSLTDTPLIDMGRACTPKTRSPRTCKHCVGMSG